MIQLKKEALKEYLSDIFGSEIKIKKIQKLGEGFHGLGYSIDTVDKDGKEKRYILKTLRGEGFGHDYPSDRANVLIRALLDYNSLPKHVKAIDVGSIQEKNKLLSIRKPKDFFIILEEGKGIEYWKDLDKIRDEGVLKSEDLKKIRVLGRYLADIHSINYNGDNRRHLYRRVVRDFVGHGELTMGVIDTFPDNLTFVSSSELVEIVKNMVEWWNRIKNKNHRLTTVHGDFYPGNIWFDNGKLVVLDRSRFRYGDPADDTTCLTMNFINYSVMSYGDFRGPFKQLTEMFFEEYFKHRKDDEMFEVSPLFFAFRAIVCIYPIFYSKEWMRAHGFGEDMVEKTDDSKRKIINFMRNVLNEKEFDVKKINSYLKD